MSPTTLTALETRSDPVIRAREDLAALFQLGARAGWQEGSGGHISMVVPGAPDRILVNTYGRWEFVIASELAVLDLDGNRLDDGGGRVDAAALFIHTCVHRANPRALVALHSHMPHATALTMLEDPTLPPAYQTALRYYGQVAYVDEYRGGVQDAEEGERIARGVAGKPVVFLANHGILVTGTTVPEVFERTTMLEEACKRHFIASQMGRLKMVAADVAEHYAARFTAPTDKTADFWASHLRFLDGVEPDYRR